MKTSITSYSYSQLYKQGSFTLFDAMDHAVSIGADGFEFTELRMPEGKTKLEFAKELKEYADAKGLPIVAYAIGANFMAKDQEAEIARVKSEVDVAAALGCPTMRHDVTGGFPDWYQGVRTYGSILPILAKGCRAVTEYAAEKGVRTCSENHGYFFQEADRVIALIEAVNHVNYGVLCDFGNFLFADDDSAVAVSKVAPCTFHVHAKDFLFKPGQEAHPGSGWAESRGRNYLRATIIGHGVVPVRQNVRILKSAGYEGYITVEFEGLESPLNAIAIGLENLKNYINQ
ncbi:MAG TPA: sugar phosphate isomerase/epimerase [Clostridiales bacterium]|jgi:sugar phosphate isomerase/epimerase|nr:sugar phosphate isomerase/epimerase [Clostridiales bacterium]